MDDDAHLEDVTEHYRHLFNRKTGQRRRRNPDAVSVRTLIQMCGSADACRRALDVWFASEDPWYRSHGFGFDRCFTAINRLVATGELSPGGTPDNREAIRAFARAALDPRLRALRGGRAGERHSLRGRRSTSRMPNGLRPSTS